MVRKNKFSVEDIRGLHQNIYHHRSALKGFRLNRYNMILECAGNWFGEYAAPRKVKMNLFSLYQSAVGRALISKNPRVHLTTFNAPQRAVVTAMEAYQNQRIEKLNVADVFQRTIIDSFYGPGINRVALCHPGDAASSGWSIKGGEACIQRIDLDDFVFDTNARTWEEVEFIGHRYRCDLEIARDMAGKHGDRLSQMPDPSFNRDGDDRIRRLAMQNLGFMEWRPHVELWEIYSPRDKAIITLSEDQFIAAQNGQGEQALWIQDWIGPDTGPYSILGMGTVPGSIMPKAPFMDLFEKQLDCNNAERKANETMRNVKENTVYRRNQDSDAKEMQRASHMEMVGLEDPEGIKNVVQGGLSVQMLQAYAMQQKQDFSFIGPNLELIAGRSQQAGTAHQEALLNENSNASLADMQERTTAHVTRVLKNDLWFAWHSPKDTYQAPHGPPHLPDHHIMRSIHPWNHPVPGMRREARFEDLGITLVPYSMTTKTPEQIVKFINETVEMMLPIMPMLQQSGIAFDPNEWLNQLSTLSDRPELKLLFTIQEPPASPDGEEQNETPHDVTSAPNTTRTSIRKNVSERTQQGTEKTMIAAGLNPGGAPQSGMMGAT